MKTLYTIHLRRFPVRIQDNLTGELREDSITFTKEQLRAAQSIGQSSRELICRAYHRAGCTVLEIGKAHKLEVPFDLNELFLLVDDAQNELEKEEYLHLHGHERRVMD